MFNEKKYLKMTAVYLSFVTDNPTPNGFTTYLPNWNKENLISDHCT
jgi:hypothetical protein